MSGQLRDVMQWMITTLNADATLASYGINNNVYFHNAPENSSYPYIILQLQSDSKTYVLGGKAFTRNWLAVKCVDHGTDGGDLARQVKTRVEDLLNFQQPSIPGGYVLDIRTTTGFEYGEAESGNMNFYHVGSVFVVNLG